VTIKVRVSAKTRDGAPWFEVMAGNQAAQDKYGACMGRDVSQDAALRDFARRASIESNETAAEPAVRVSDLVIVEDFEY
jgi:hypothetical protein